MGAPISILLVPPSELPFLWRLVLVAAQRLLSGWTLRSFLEGTIGVSLTVAGAADVGRVGDRVGEGVRLLGREHGIAVVAGK